MIRALAKISHKYEFLKLELEERQDELKDYLDKWNSIVGKYLMDKQKVMWVDEETGEVRIEEPKEKPKAEPAPRLRKLYRKLSRHAHPDKGGNVEDFNELKKAYEDKDIIELIKFAVKYGEKIDLVESDSKLIEEKITSISNKINEIDKSLVWQFFHGDENIKKQVIEELQLFHDIKLSEKDIKKFLEF